MGADEGVVPSGDVHFAWYVGIYISEISLKTITIGSIKKGNRKSEILLRDVEVHLSSSRIKVII